MLDSLKQAGKTVTREFGRAWETLSLGWRELLCRSSDALTYFARSKAEDVPLGKASHALPNWALLAGEVEETGDEVVVRLEVPGLEKADCRIAIEGDALYLSGEKRFVRETQDSTWHVMERAYGAFSRVIALPHDVDTARAVATYRHGVITVRLPKGASDRSRVIPIS